MLVYSKVKRLEVGKGVQEYIVCLNEFKDDEKLCLLPCCSHIFHLDYINAWLASYVTCFVYHANLSEQAINNNLNIFSVATLTTNATGLQLSTIAPPQDHIAIIVDL